MGRVINPDSVGKERARLTRAIVLAIRTMAQQSEPNDQARDLAAFITLALEAVARTIDPTVAAWEKRDYWVKADRFRMDWAWAGQLSARLRIAVLCDDWPAIAQIAVQIAGKLSKVQVSANHRLGAPWQGARKRLISKA